MLSPKRPPPPIQCPPPKQRKCGGCGQFGHDRRNCPTAPRPAPPAAAANPPVDRNPVNAVPPPPPLAFTAVDWEKVLYVVFDLETTGRVRQRDEIIEVAASVHDKNGIPLEDALFTQFAKPTTSIPAFITQLTNITDDDVADAEPFPAVADAFIRFMQQHAEDNDGDIDHIILVGHNAKVFDVPFLCKSFVYMTWQIGFFKTNGLALLSTR
jgi:DNA polymerase III epsilon subunit-like protein